MLTLAQIDEHCNTLTRLVTNGEEAELKQFLAKFKDDLPQLFNDPRYEKEPIWYQALNKRQPVITRLLIEAGAKSSATYQEWQTLHKFYELNSPPISPAVEAFSQVLKDYITQALNPAKTIDRATFKPAYDKDPFTKNDSSLTPYYYYLSSYLVSDRAYELIRQHKDAIPGLNYLYKNYVKKLKTNPQAPMIRNQLPDYYWLEPNFYETPTFKQTYFPEQLPKINYLHIAAAIGDLNLVKWFLEQKNFTLNFNSRKTYEPLLKIAHECKQPLMVAYLANVIFNQSAGYKIINSIIQNQPLESLIITFNTLITLKPDHPAYRYCLLTTVYTDIKNFQRAIYCGQHELVEIYLEAAPTNSQLIDQQENTLLHRAVLQKNKEFLLLGCRYNVDKQAKNKQNKTALQLSFDLKRYELSLILLQNGAILENDIILPDANDNTLLHKAVQEKLMPLLVIGIEADIDPDVKNKQNKTALQLAVDTNQKELAVKLLEHGATVDADYQVKLVNLGVNIAGIIMQVNRRLAQVNKQISATQVAQNQQQAKLIAGLLETRNLAQETALEFARNPQLMPTPAYQHVLVEELGVEPQLLLDKPANLQLTDSNNNNLLTICAQIMQTVQQQAFMLRQHDLILRQQQALLQEYVLNSSSRPISHSPTVNTSQVNNYLNFFPPALPAIQTSHLGPPISLFANPEDRPEQPGRPVAVGLTANDTEEMPLRSGPIGLFSNN